MNIKLAIKRKISKLIKVLYKITYKYIPINNKIVLFVSYHGKGYLCNPKYLHKYMSMNEKYKEFKYVWAVKNYKDTNIENAKVVRYNGLLYFYYLARSKYWIINCKMPKYILKKEKQIYIQTWHGTPLKRLAHDIDIGQNATFYRSKMSRSEMTETYDNDVKKYDYFISPNVFATDKFKSSFKIKQEI
ncbi:CDP-glycerol glycerophosphotransferase family protein, partial [uncultured Clostridium sp.]|uniref:CDP-glycerol glycerophosphotransferase family protein n=1 Tax=uncultured Clostridium sp. TaxID=59620 RepID=UPI0025928AA0